MSNSSENEINWKEKYISLKKKLKELRNIRIDSPKKDAEDLRKKIAEHQKVHEISVNELRQQNQELKLAILDIETASKDAKKLEEHIQKIKEYIKRKDYVIYCFSEYNEFETQLLENSHYKITQNFKNDPFIFHLFKIERGFRYKLVRMSETVSSNLDYDNLFKNDIEFDDLNKFVHQLHKLYLHCNSEKR